MDKKALTLLVAQNAYLNAAIKNEDRIVGAIVNDLVSIRSDPVIDERWFEIEVSERGSRVKLKPDVLGGVGKKERGQWTVLLVIYAYKTLGLVKVNNRLIFDSADMAGIGRAAANRGFLKWRQAFENEGFKKASHWWLSEEGEKLAQSFVQSLV